MFNRLYNLRLRRHLVLSLAGFACLMSASVQAEYVTDQFEVMFRSGPSVQNKIIRPLVSDTAVEILVEDAGNGHSQVRTQRGEVGYVLNRYLTQQVPARRALESAEAQLEALTQDEDAVASQLRMELDKNSLLIDQNMALTDQIKALETQLAELTDASGNVLEIRTRNEQLEDQANQLLLQLDDFRIQTETLRDSTERRTMLISASLVVLGLFLGWLLSRSGRRRSGSAW